MKNSLKALLAVATVSFSLVSCDKFKDLEEPLKASEETPEQTDPATACTETTFLDAGLCNGAWFKTNEDVYLQVSNFNAQGEPIILEQGETFSFTYEPYVDQGEIRCEAISTFEQDLYESKVLIERVSLLEICE